MKKNKILLAIFLLSVLLIFVLQAKSNSKKEYESVESFMQFLTLLQENHIYELSIDTLIDFAIDGIIKQMDIHTNYLQKSDLEHFSTQTEGHFGGLGIIINKIGDYTTVLEPIDNTPAQRVGMIAGDKIVEVNGENVIGMDIDKLIRLLKGKPGTIVNVTVERVGKEDWITFEIVRDVIPIASIPYVIKFDNGVGYIKIRQFNGNATKEFGQALEELESQNIKGLIIDLRSNPGGLLSEAISTVDFFIEKDKLLLTTRGIKESNTRQYYTNREKRVYNYPIVVIINEASASASEIFAGVLQDYDKAIIIGSTSYGKGSVQQLYYLRNGDGVKITVSKYYIPSGRSIHRDINDSLVKQETQTNEDNQKNLELDKTKKRDKIYRTSGGRKVYGSGGIYPDLIFKPDTISSIERVLLVNNSYFDYSVIFHEESDIVVDEDFIADESIINDFFEFVKNEKDIELALEEVESVYNAIKINLESSIIKQNFSRDVAKKRLSLLDSQLQEALHLFDKFDSLDDMLKYVEIRNQ